MQLEDIIFIMRINRRFIDNENSTLFQTSPYPENKRHALIPAVCIVVLLALKGSLKTPETIHLFIIKLPFFIEYLTFAPSPLYMSRLSPYC